MFVKQPKGTFLSNHNYLYLKADSSGITQLSEKQMRASLREYAKNHPEDTSISKSGKPKPAKIDRSKGTYIEY